MANVLIRVDYNVPIESGHVVDDQRIRATLSTIKQYLNVNNSVLLVTHLGRPKEYDPKYSVRPIASHLSTLLGKTVEVLPHWPSQSCPFLSNTLYLAENVRFLAGETENDERLAQSMAINVDVVVNEAFSVAHREHASNVGIAQHLSNGQYVFGDQFQYECDQINTMIHRQASPRLAIVGGSKIDTKLGLLNTLLDHVDVMVLGGGLANTCLSAQGHDIGLSICEPSHLDLATSFMNQVRQKGKQLYLPVDCVVSQPSLGEPEVKSITSVLPNEAIYDFGPDSIRDVQALIQSSESILWNGPVGWFERSEFSLGTLSIARFLDQVNAHVLVGGGDSLRALSMAKAKQIVLPGGDVQSGLFRKFASTGGGAFLYLIEHGCFPCHAINQYKGVSE